jgi:hypothetical protein
MQKTFLFFTSCKAGQILAYQSVELERTWWRLFQKRVLCAKFDIYVFIKTY